MGADFSRVRANPLLDYAGVELKQGSVLLDADANELMAILDRRLRALASDTLGRNTVSATTPNAFKISVAAGTLQIGKGRLYVDGLLAENHGAPSDDPAKRVFDALLAEPQFADPIAYTAQPSLPSPPELPAAGRHLVYLDVWNREVTHLEQPDLVESAVNVETTSRLQTIWQVRVLEKDVEAGVTCDSPDADLDGWSDLIAPSTGVLTTSTYEVAAVVDPCELPPTGGYRGLENQLYRVEIHHPGQPGAGATFKWSRENASVGSRVASIVSATELELETLGRDEVLRFNTGDWVEITDRVREMSQQAGELRRVTVDEATRRIQFSPALPAPMLPSAFPDSTLPNTNHMRVRRWDQKGFVYRTAANGPPVQVQNLNAAGSTGVIDVPAAGTTLLLENGVTVSFASTGAKGFRAGDFWVFAARTADASVEILDRAPPRGIHHHYARLGIWDVAAGTVSDCRHHWPPENEGHDCSCTACVTAESHASGTFTIQDAVNKLQERGGTVCLGVGQYALAEPVRLMNARSLRIRGQGTASVVVGPGCCFLLQDCLAIAIENLTILSLGRQSAVSIHTVLGLSLCHLVLGVLASADNRSSAISLEGIVAGASIRDNAILGDVGIGALDPAAAPPIGDEPNAKFLITAALAIEDNLLWCQRSGVVLDEAVFNLLGTRITGNDFVGCSEGGVSTLGLGAAGSSMVISGNNFGLTGTGIRCSVDGAWIEGNKLRNGAAGAAAQDGKAVGIQLVPGFDRNGADQMQILANQVSGFPGAGIEIGAQVRDLIVKLNIIDDCGNGILSSASAKSAAISIENNHLRNIGPSEGTEANVVVGVGVYRAESATIAGNTIRSVGLLARQAQLRVAILALGVLQPRLRGNDVAEVGPPGDFADLAGGIMLIPPYSDFDISNNQVQRDIAVAERPNEGKWFALFVGNIELKPVFHTGTMATMPIDSTRTLVFNAGHAFIAALDKNSPVRGSMLGNVLNARGIMAAVNVFVPGECLFNDNRVEATTKDVAVRLTTDVVIVNANRVRGGELSMLLTAEPKFAAVLGNVTTAMITFPSGPLAAPWDVLNVRAP